MNQKKILWADCLAEDAVTIEPVSGPKFPTTGKNTGNLEPVSGSTHVQAPIKTGVKGMQLEIVREHEQGNNRSDNREKASRNRSVTILRPSRSRTESCLN